MKNLNISLFLIFLLFANHEVNATLVVPALKANKIGNSLTLTGSLKTAKTSIKRTSYLSAFTYTYGTNNTQFLTFGNITYGDVDGKKYLDKHLIHTRYIQYYFFNEMHLETFLQTEQNDIALVSERTLGGVGISHIFGKKNPNFTHHILAGIMIENEKHLLDDSLDRKNTRFTFSNQLEASVFENSKVTFINYIQPKASSLKNMRFIADLSISVPLSSNLSLSVSGNYRKYTEAFEGIPENTHSFSTSFTYSF